MNVLLDTPIWSLVLRRQARERRPKDDLIVQEFRQLVEDERVRIIGPIRQEILSGIKEERHYERIKRELRRVEDEPLTTSDFELAAKLYNRCRSHGVAGSDVDLLICAVALDRNWLVYTTDLDFNRYAKVTGVHLHAVPDFNPIH